MMVNELDLECKLISAKTIYVDDVPIIPIALDTIFDMGYSNYNKVLMLTTIKSSKISSLIDYDITDDDLYDFFVINCINDKEMMDEILNFFKLLCGHDVKFLYDLNVFLIEFGNEKYALIHKQNFLQIQEIIRKRNCIENIEEDIDNPANERARQILEKRNKCRKKITEIKSKENGSDGLTIVDLVSILASGLHMEISQVLKYDLYQFNNQFNRLKIFKEYDVNIQALLAGANKDDVNLKHWITRIDIENE